KELHKRSRHPKFKKKYKVTNWKEYEQSLFNRGSLTLGILPLVINSWGIVLNRFTELEGFRSELVV
ncbi:MAG: hypothetical protein CMK59_07795, partial [Proteobacteria bacterium]|nr:hypothetical protein [Pseudomonadota bacterium]